MACDSLLSWMGPRLALNEAEMMRGRHQCKRPSMYSRVLLIYCSRLQLLPRTNGSARPFESFESLEFFKRLVVDLCSYCHVSFCSWTATLNFSSLSVIMMETSEVSALEPPSVALSANQSLQSFQHCLAAATIHPRELSMVEDQLARFSTWAASIGIFAPGRGSMDHRLRYTKDLQNVVIGLLDSLSYRIQACTSLYHHSGPSKYSNTTHPQLYFVCSLNNPKFNLSRHKSTRNSRFKSFGSNVVYAVTATVFPRYRN